jgi:hypothetical protein
MSGRKRLGWFVAVAGVLLLAGSGVLWKKHTPRIEEIRVQSAALEDSVRHVHAGIVQQSLELQGLMASMKTVPDSVRRYGGRKYMDAAGGYDKAIRKYEMQERDIKLEIAALRRESEREHTSARATAMPAAIAGLLAVLVGLVLALLPGRRVDA